MRSRLWIIAVVILLMGIVPSCGSDPVEPSDITRVENSVPSPSIVCLSPNCTEIIIALGMADHLLGRSGSSNYIDAVADVEVVGESQFNVNVERLFQLKPDLVLMLGGTSDVTNAIEQKLNSAGIESLTVRTDSMAQTIAGIEAIAKRLQLSKQGQKIVEQIETSMQTVKLKLQDFSKQDLKVLLVISRTPGTLNDVYAAGPASPLGEVLQRIGVKNALPAAASAWQSLSKEELIRLNPDIILDINPSMQTYVVPPTVEVWNILSSVSAVKNKRIRIVGDNCFVIMGPGLAQVATSLVRELEPMQEQHK